MLSCRVTRPSYTETFKSGESAELQKVQIQCFGKDGLPEELPRIVQCYPPKGGYPMGEYELSPASVSVGAYDKLQIRLVLVPKGTGAKSTAAK